jgi:hypothetical protein
MTKQDIDLQKIHVLESSYQAWFNLKSTVIITLIIGFLILISTVTYEKLINLQTMAFADFLIMAIFAFLIYNTRKSHDAHMFYVSELILRVEKGERLCSLEELRGVKKSSKNK